MPPRLEGAGAAPTPEPIGQVGELQVEQHQHLIDGLDAGGPRYMPAPQRALGRAGATAGVPLCVEIMGVLVPRSRAMAEGEAKPTLLPLAAEMTPSQREAYERECLEELQHRVERVQPSAHRFHLVRAVRLEGRYPETAIRVEWLDTRNDRERERRFLLWINPVTRKPPGSFEYGPEGKLVGREVPEQVAMLIQVWVEEN
jgi:hypothetical protein